MPGAPSSSGAGQRADVVSPRSRSTFERLRTRSEIGRVYRIGTRRQFGGITVISAPGEFDRHRIAVVAGRRVGSAVRRNRAKRRIREALRRTRFEGAGDHVVIVSGAVVEAPFGELVGWVRRIEED